MAGIDVNADGFMDMDPEPTGQAVARIKAAGDAFAQVWATQQGLIESNAAKLGKPHLGAAFKALYDPLAEPASKMAGDVAAQLGQLADVGTTAVTDYIAADKANKDTLQRRD